MKEELLFSLALALQTEKKHNGQKETSLLCVF